MTVASATRRVAYYDGTQISKRDEWRVIGSGDGTAGIKRVIISIVRKGPCSLEKLTMEIIWGCMPVFYLVGLRCDLKGATSNRRKSHHRLSSEFN